LKNHRTMDTKKAFILSFALLLSAFGFAQFVQKHSWKSVDTGGTGFVPGFCYSKTEKDVLYARTDVGGAYKWDETNQSWNRITDWITETEWPLMGIQAMCIDPKKPERVYMMGGLYINPPSCIMRSDDYGKTFKRFVTPFQISGVASPSGERLCIDPNNTAVLYCGTYKNGLWKSADNGETWTEITAFRTAVTVTTGEVLRVSFVVVDPSTGTNGSTSPRLIAGLNRLGNNNMYISNDAGVTWQPITGLPTTSAPQRGELSPNGFLYSTFSNLESPAGYGTLGGFYKINLATKTAADITPQAIHNCGYCGIAIDQTNSNHMLITNTSGVKWAATGSYGERIWRTKDGGVSWVDLASSSLVVMDYQGYSYAAGVNPHWVSNIGLDPFNSNRFFFNTGYGVYRCDNLGDYDLGKTITFKFSSKNLNESVVFDVIAPKSGAQLIHSIGDYSGFRHMNVSLPGSRFTPAGGANNPSIDAAELNPNIVVRATSNPANGAMYSADNAVTWTKMGNYVVTDSVYAGKIAVSAAGNTIVWAPLNKAVRVCDVSDRATWYLCQGIPNNLKPVSDKVFDGKFYATNGTSLYYCEDGGLTFRSFGLSNYGIPTGTGSYGNIRTFPTHEGEVWLPLYERGLYCAKFSNAVPQFTKIPNVITCKSVSFGAPKTGSGQVASIFISGTVKTSSFYGIFRSDDMGATWIQVNDNEHLFGGIGQLIGDPNIYGRVYMTTGGGLGVIYCDVDGEIINGDIETPATTIKVGAAQTYTTIQAAYNSIPDNISASTLIEIQADYAPASETYPIVFAKKTSASDANYILIRPATDVQKQLSSTNAIMSFNGASYVKVDGRPNGVGTASGLTLSNTSTASGAKTIEFINDSRYNTVRYCTVMGSGKSSTSGTIVIGTTTGATARGGSAGSFTGSGNLYNTIDHCNITNASAGLPYNALYLKGTPTYTNEGTVISNNSISNFFTDATDVKSCGVLNDLDSHTTQIAGNNFYQSETRVTAGGGLIYPIYIHSSGAISSIANNVIGGNNESGTGVTTIQSSGTARFAGIYINALKGGTTIAMSGNKISGIDLTSYSPGNGTDGVLAGIVVKGGNLSAAVATNPNEISQLTLRFGVSISSSNGLCGLSYNFGGGSSIPGYLKVNNLNAIPTGANANTIVGKVVGLYSSGSYGGSCTAVEVHDLSCGSETSSAAHQLYGISHNTGSNQRNTVERNSVYNLNAISSGTGTVYGIAAGAGTNTLTLKNNMICLGNNMSSGASIRGIYKNTTGADVIIHNSVYIGGAVSNTTQNTFAFIRDVAAENTVTGNVISNNIFVNKRRGGSGGKHYVLSSKLATDFSLTYPITCNYNCYDKGNGANNVFGIIATTDYDFSTWKTTTKQDANSILADPVFVDAANVTTPDLSIKKNYIIVDGKGNASTTATDDYFGSIRSGLTPCDMGAFAYVYDPNATIVYTKENQLKVGISNSSILIRGYASKTIHVFSIEGRLIQSVLLPSDNEIIKLKRGCYVVRIENRMAKVIIN